MTDPFHTMRELRTKTVDPRPGRPSGMPALVVVSALVLVRVRKGACPRD